MKNKVVITGLGAITPIGNTVEDFWNNVKEGICGIDFIKSFNTEGYKIKIAAEVKNFNPVDYFSHKESKRLDRFSQLGIAAAKEAYEDAGLNNVKIDRERISVVVGNGVGGISTIQEEVLNLNNHGEKLVSPLFIPKSLPNIAAANISIALNAKGMSKTVITACSSGTDAIGEAFRLVQHDEADIVITGGFESCITPLMVSGFTNLNALCTSNNPKRASIPFDKNRSGFVIGEGAGIIILESLKHALDRNAKIYGEIVGYGSTCDAYHLIAPGLEGEGIARSMKRAIKDAGIEPENVSYINAHGTSTLSNDKSETQAIKSVFHEQAYRIPISSTKSMIGHLLGAAGAVEAIACIKSIQDNFIHATIGYSETDKDCDLDYVPNKGRVKELKYVLSSSSGFGGHNSSIVIKKWKDLY